MKPNENAKNIKLYFMLFIYAFALLLLCTKSSPLYSINDWYDANVYYTMGKGWAHGLLPYLHLEDNKGPLLYFFYLIAYLIDNNGFMGMYMIQSVFLGLSIIYTYKTANIFLKNNVLSALVACISPVFFLVEKYYALGFDYGGGGPDELCRGLICISLYYFVLYFYKEDEYKLRHTFIQGLLTAMVLMMKHIIAVFWAGFLLIIFIRFIYRRNYKGLLKNISAYASGLAAVIFPFLLYLKITGSFSSFIDCYIRLNIIYSDQESRGIISTVFLAFSNIFEKYKNDLLLTMLTLAGVFYLLLFNKHKTVFKTAYFLSLFITITALFFSVPYAYTMIPATVFSIMGLIGTGDLIKKINIPRGKIFRRGIAGSLFCLSFILIVINNKLIYSSIFKSDEIPVQQQVAAIIQEDGLENPTLLEIDSLDSGFYTAAGILPSEKYFYVPNIDYKVYPQPLDSQLNCIVTRSVDYAIITMKSSGKMRKGYSDNVRIQIIDTLTENYEEIAVLQKTNFSTHYYYHVFKLKK